MEEIDLKEVAKTFWNKKVHVIIIVAIFITIGSIYTFNFVTPKYTAKTTLILSSINSKRAVSADTEYTDTSVIDKDITLNSKLVSTYSELIKSKNILSKVRTTLDIAMDENELKKLITVDTVEDTELIRISVENESNELACYIANEVADVFKEQIKVYYDIENVQIVDRAEIETEPSNIHHKRDIAIFGLLGVVVAVGYVLILNMLDTTIKSIEDVENVTQLPVLAKFPTFDTFGKNNTRGNSKKAKTKSKTRDKKKGGNKHE